MLLTTNKQSEDCRIFMSISRHSLKITGCAFRAQYTVNFKNYGSVG